MVISRPGDVSLALRLNREGSGGLVLDQEINSLIPARVYEERALVCAAAARPKRILIIGFGGGYPALFAQKHP